MTGTRAPAAVRRPPAVTAVAGVLLFLGVTALAGGTAMIIMPSGGGYLPRGWLDDIPVIDSWLVPGIVLGAGFGVGSLVTAYGVIRRPRRRWTRPAERLTGRHWSWSATILIGAAMLSWIGLELAYLPDRSWLEALYGLVGLVLVLLPLSRPVRDHLTAPGT